MTRRFTNHACTFATRTPETDHQFLVNLDEPEGEMDEGLEELKALAEQAMHSNVAGLTRREHDHRVRPGKTSSHWVPIFMAARVFRDKFLYRTERGQETMVGRFLAAQVNRSVMLSMDEGRTTAILRCREERARQKLYWFELDEANDGKTTDTITPEAKHDELADQPPAKTHNHARIGQFRKMLEATLGSNHCPFEIWTPEHGRVLDRLIAYDTETTLIDDENPHIVPALVLATACDGHRGVFLSRTNIRPFLDAHQGSHLIAHNAAFDLKVTQLVLGRQIDLYGLVERGLVWDTEILHRLLTLATKGHTARGTSSLRFCVSDYLGLDLPKELVGADGTDVRTGFGQYLGRPITEIPPTSLEYAARDALATRLLFNELNRRIRAVLRQSHGTWGYVNEDWLKSVIQKFGPLTHHIQLRASILCDVLRSNGIGIDSVRATEKQEKLQELSRVYKERLRRRGFLPGFPGSSKALQSILAQFQRQHPEIRLKRTESDEQFSTAEEDLVELASVDTFFRDLVTYRAAEKMLSTYLSKMNKKRLRTRFGYLLQTGCTFCGGGFNLQNLPRETDESEAARTIRGCFVPGENQVFIDSDYSQIELVVLAHVLKVQFNYGHNLADVINAGQDVHRLIAATVLGKPADDVTKAERNSAKPISFGRPGGMGPERLRQIAQASYGIDLTVEQVQKRIDAYHTLCPELNPFLEDEVDAGRVLATKLNLTPSAYAEATGSWTDHSDPIRCPNGQKVG